MIEALQSLRFVFVIMIFMSHFAYRGIEPFDAGGDCGVAFFFILSGFVVSLGYGRQVSEGTFRYSRFIGRRIVKLYPLHLLCLAFFLVVSARAIDYRVLLNLFLLQSWVPDIDVYFSCNSVSWFLSSLFFCYLVFPFVNKHVSIKLAIGILLLYVLVAYLTPYDEVNAILYVNPLVRFVDFYIGMVLYRFYERGYRLGSPTTWECLVIVFLLMTLAAYPYVDAKLRNAPLYWIVLVPLVLVFAKGDGAVSSVLRAKPMLMLASLSMPMYMIHQMAIGILLHRLPLFSYHMMLFVCLLAVLVAGWLIDRFFLRQIGRVDNNLRKSAFILI